MFRTPELMRPAREKSASKRSRDLKQVLQLIHQLKSCSCRKDKQSDRYFCGPGRGVAGSGAQCRPEAEEEDYYATLGLARTATSEDIKKAHRAMALKWHPDRNRNNTQAATLMFLKTQKAYDVLIDSARRARYDAGRGGAPHRPPDNN